MNDETVYKIGPYLCHFGTKGHSGRYPLGSGEDPYQDYPNMRKHKGSQNGVVRTGKGTPIGLFAKRKAKKQSIAEAKQRQAQLDEKLKEQKIRTKIESIKKDPNIKDLQKYKKYMSNDDIKTALDRLDAYGKIDQVAQKQGTDIKRTSKWIDDNIVTPGRTAANFADIVISLYDDVQVFKTISDRTRVPNQHSGGTKQK